MAKYYTKVKDCDVPYEAQMWLLKQFAAHSEKDICLTVTRGRKRSLSQNAFLHHFLSELGDRFREFGMDYSDEMVKTVFKHQFGFKEIIELPGGQKEIIDKSTADYTTIECEQAMERCREHYKDFFALPYPTQLGYEE